MLCIVQAVNWKSFAWDFTWDTTPAEARMDRGRPQNPPPGHRVSRPNFHPLTFWMQVTSVMACETCSVFVHFSCRRENKNRTLRILRPKYNGVQWSKVFPVHAMAYRSKAPLILNLGDRWRWLVNFKHQANLPAENNPDSHWIGGWVGSKVSLGVFGKEKNILPLPGFEPQAVQPVT